MDDEAIRAVARQALERKTGARGLRGILESTMTEIMYEIPSRDDVEKCIITKETIEMKGRPKLVLKASSQLKDQRSKRFIIQATSVALIFIAAGIKKTSEAG